MLTSEVINTLREMISRRGDRPFEVTLVLDGQRVPAPVVTIVARAPRGGTTITDPGTIGFDVLLNRS